MARIALRSTARAIDWLPVAAAGAVGIGAVGWAVGSSHGGPEGAPVSSLRLAMLALAVGAATAAADDASATTVAASPVPLSVRRALRTGVVLAAWAVSWACVMLIASRSATTPAIAQHTIEAAGWVVLGLAITTRLGAGAAPGLLALFVLAHQLPDQLTLLGAPSGWSAVQGRWALAVIVGAVVIAGSSRDPSRRRRR